MTHLNLRRYRNFTIIAGSVNVAAGLLYLVMQWILTGTVADTVYICLSIGASLFILLKSSHLHKYIISQGPSYYTSAIMTYDEPDRSKVTYDKLVAIFTDFPRNIGSGLLYGAGGMAVPYLLGWWQEVPILRLYFGIFLFTICIITGYFLLVLIRFLIIITKLWEYVKIELWKRMNASVNFLIAISRKEIFIAAIYISICLTAWVTNPVVPIGSELIAYSIFSMLLLLASLIFPILPYTQRLMNLKDQEIGELDDKIQQEYSRIIMQYRESAQEIHFEQLNTLIEMRKRIEEIQVYPFKVKSLVTSISVILISLLPAIVQFLLEWNFAR